MTMNSTTIRMVLNSVTALLVVIGVFVWLREPEMPRVDLPARQVTTNRGPNSMSGPTPSANGSAIVSSNVFAASRVAPAKRYTPPGAGGGVVDPTEPMRLTFLHHLRRSRGYSGQ